MTGWSHDDSVAALYCDGRRPIERSVRVRQDLGHLVVLDMEEREQLARWPMGALRPVPDTETPDVLRLRLGEGDGERLTIFDRAFNEELMEWWPALNRRLVADRFMMERSISLSVVALIAVVLFFAMVVPELARLGAQLVPPDLERRTARVVAREDDLLYRRIASARDCDISGVGEILAKLTTPLRTASNWSEPIRLRVIDDPLPNAAAVVGGEIVVFSGMLDFVRSGDELAGILAHEFGHVVARHSLRQMFATSLNFFGFDQAMGDFAGQIIVHPLSGMLLSRRQARQAEFEADMVAARVLSAAKVSLRPLADLFDRMAYLQGERELSMGWLSTHPLSSRRARIIRNVAPAVPHPPVLSTEELAALRRVCQTGA